MKTHFAAACLLGTALVAAPAFAQDSSSSTPPMNAPAASGQFLTQMEAQQWRGSKLVGIDVYGSDNSKIGDINEVIVDHNGQAKAIVIGVGGFLGIGEKNVAIPWDKVQWNAGGGQSSGSMANASATSQPAGDRSSPRDIAQTTTGSPSDTNAQPPQSIATGGATLSSPPASSANPSASTASTAAPAAPSTMAGSNSVASTSTSSAPSSSMSSASSQAQDYPDRALVSMSKQDLQNAPEFHYASQAASSGGAAKSGAGTSSMGGSTTSTGR